MAPARAAAGLTASRFYHVTWHESHGRWQAAYKLRRQGEGAKTQAVSLGFHDTEEAAAFAANTAILALPPDVRGNIRINPVDGNGKLVPHDWKSPGAAQAATKKRKAAERAAAGGSNDAPVPLTSRSVDELKAICRRRNLRVSGKKAELVQRIKDDDAKPAAKPAAKRPKTAKKPAKKSAKKKHCFENVDYGRPYATKRRRTAAPT